VIQPEVPQTDIAALEVDEAAWNITVQGDAAEQAFRAAPA
jgi:hypothetical protein